MQAQTLTVVQRGTEVLVERIDLDGSNRTRLLRLGICEGRSVRVAQIGDPLIVLAVGSRIGVSRQLAENIYVRIPE